MERKEVGHVYIPAFIMAMEDLLLQGKVLYGKIIGLCGSKGYCYASNEWLGQQIGLSGKRVSFYIAKYVASGIMVREVERNEKGEVIRRKLFPVFRDTRGGPPVDEHTPPPVDEQYIQDISIQEKREEEKTFYTGKDLERWNSLTAIDKKLVRAGYARIVNGKLEATVFDQ